MIARIDAKSKIVVDGLLQIADQLKPDQRAELTTRLARDAASRTDGLRPAALGSPLA